ncbi:hypothetical protein HDG34_003114 [Paraburkholderia sp. HC6.4b]|uniref:hypothetical protein n=1 Tax=unclassified Paraburkholderia TaxID=2615204 RepID=UPI00160878B4|nr:MULTISPECIES: hypothetical protein [unclassified Paraburkholderia]MBB5409173.1 hypothetical protein [Paraburkholderia sp. HC6.4b]MBB5450901.1 hypothetical protein [Paraburkholderia sp. Kb1A]
MNVEGDPLEVIVQGGSIDANTVVYGVVQGALSDAGFTGVTVSSPQGERAAHVGRIPTMLDALRVSRPELFATPINVKQQACVEEVGSLIADNPDHLDLGHIVYGTGDSDDVDPGVSAEDAAQVADKSMEAEAVQEQV